jgi:hypothetical protein
VGTTDTVTTTELIPGIHAEVPPTSMRVRKRNGSFEPVTVEKIIRAVERSAVAVTGDVAFSEDF